MDRKFLREYQDREIQNCESLFQDDSFRFATITDRLRMLYGAPLDEEIIYCESGGLENLNIYPPDKTIVLTVFPYKTKDLFEQHLGPINDLLYHCLESKRIIPVLQSPLYYEGLRHFRPFFDEISPPSYFVRGQFAYATVMGTDRPELVKNHIGGTSLRKIFELMQVCESNHSQWLSSALKDSDCWEIRYKKVGPLDRNSQRLRESLKYRYASVAFFLGQEMADDIIKTFDYVIASRILLHFHVLFDHAIAHGFGSHFSVDEESEEGEDFCGGKVRIWDRFATQISGLRLLIPAAKNEYYHDLIQYEHPLEGIRLDSLELGDFEEISYRIRARFEEFRKKIERMEKSQPLIERFVRISLLTGGLLEARQDPVKGIYVAGLASKLRSLDLPQWLSDGALKSLKKLHERNLAIFLLNSRWN